MIRALPFYAVLVTMVGCQPTPAEDDGGSSETGGSSSSTVADDTTGPTGPTGPCPLEGMFEACDADGTEGVAYCDDIGGELQWGQCLPSVACELGESLQGCQRCTLVEGVPTITGSPTCECEGPADAPPCEQTECLQRWDWSCDTCESFTSGDCFSYDQGCANPRLDCLIDARFPCDRVWAQSGAEYDVLSVLEDEAAAVCVLTSLRDGVPGTYEILWGQMDDGGWVTLWVHSGGAAAGGGVLVEWIYDCPGCINFGSVGRSGMMLLQPGTYFDDCLAAPTPESLIECTVGLLEYQPSSPPPEGYVPPFVTGQCVVLESACP